MHPLAGADPATLNHVLALAGPLSERGAAALRRIRRAVLLRQPFSAIERAWVAPRLPALDAIEPPVFILGHWRSGTTNLYQMMVKAGFGFVPPLVTGLPWDSLVLGRLMRRQIEAQLPQTRFIDNVPVNPDSPQEDEIALANMSPVSFYHGIYFPARLERFVAEGVFFDGLSGRAVTEWQAIFRYFLRKLALHQKKPLLIKNPVYTARLAMLAAMLPQSRFIHIHRHPFDVFLSMRNFYAKLLEEFALQDWDPSAIDPLIIATYRRMMEALMADKTALPPGRFIELRYDDVMAQPLAALERAWAELGLGDFEAHRGAFEAYAAAQARFEPNRFGKDAAAAGLVREQLGDWCERLGYALPA
jgi:hypothetical protein